MPNQPRRAGAAAGPSVSFAGYAIDFSHAIDLFSPCGVDCHTWPIERGTLTIAQPEISGRDKALYVGRRHQRGEEAAWAGRRPSVWRLERRRLERSLLLPLCRRPSQWGGDPLWGRRPSVWGGDFLRTVQGGGPCVERLSVLWGDLCAEDALCAGRMSSVQGGCPLCGGEEVLCAREALYVWRRSSSWIGGPLC